MKYFLEISNIAAACENNPYESKEKTLLTSWCRHKPKDALQFLVNIGCINDLTNESYSDLQKEVYKNMLPEDFDMKDTKKIEDKIISEYSKKRNHKETKEEVKALIDYTKDKIVKDHGNQQEPILIKREKYRTGNDRMYYYEIGKNKNNDNKRVIGGKHDATDDDIVIEIKTRTRKTNVRRNDYDIYQLIGYLLALNKTKGKIVQIFNKEKFDSDIPSDIEFGLVNIKEEPWKTLAYETINKLNNYFDELEDIVEIGRFKYINSVIPLSIRPIGLYDNETKKIKDENVKFLKMLNFLN